MSSMYGFSRRRGYPIKKNTKGFSLIELVIVVLIIGILAAIAIPNFLKFQAKSKTSEAKANLKAIHTSQASYFGENGNFGTFTQINWIPLGKALIYGYSMNGSVPTAAQATAGQIVVDASGLQYASSRGLTGLTQSWAAPAPYTALGTLTPMLAADNQSFIVGAAGNVSTQSKNADCWVITDNNFLLNTLDGI